MNIKYYFYMNFIIQNLLCNGNPMFDEQQYFFVVRCFEIEKTNYRTGYFVGGTTLRLLSSVSPATSSCHLQQLLKWRQDDPNRLRALAAD